MGNGFSMKNTGLCIEGINDFIVGWKFVREGMVFEKGKEVFDGNVVGLA